MSVQVQQSQLRICIRDISKAIDANRSFFRKIPFTVNPQTFEVQFPTLWQRLWHWRDPSFYTRLNIQTATAFQIILQTQNGRLPATVGEDNLVRVASRFFKTLNKSDSGQPEIAQVKDQLFAIKLGISVEILNDPKNGDFKKFAQVNHLDRYLWKYGHSLQVSEESGAIWIHWKGKENSNLDGLTITKDKEIFIDWRTMTLDANGKIRGQYLQSGYYPPTVDENGNFIDWINFRPFMQKDPSEWGNTYLFEFCTWLEDSSPRCRGDHVWVKLYTPEGDVYSIGYYPEAKARGLGACSGPLRVQPGSTHNPDESDLWPGESYTTIAVETDKEAFDKIIKEVERFRERELRGKQGTGDVVYFQPFKENCASFTKDLARIAGIEVPTARPYQNVFFPKKIVWFSEKVYAYMPRIVQIIVDFAVGIIFNLLALCLGAGKIDSRLPKKQNIKPMIATWSGMFNWRNTLIHHPYTLGHDVYHRVMEWRKDLPYRANRLPPQMIMA